MDIVTQRDALQGRKSKAKGGGEINSHSIAYNLKRSAVKKLNEIALNRNS